jgi:hypothetical protein
MILDPFRLYRRHQRLVREAREEARHLRRRHGDEALIAACDKLRRPELTTWGHRVLERTIKILRET